MENIYFKVIVAYCGSWGYKPTVRIIDSAVKKLYPLAEVESVEIPGLTGRFEVEVHCNG